MNFFDVQDKARRTSRRLVFLYVLSTAMIVAGVSLIVGYALYGVADPTSAILNVSVFRATGADTAWNRYCDRAFHWRRYLGQDHAALSRWRARCPADGWDVGFSGHADPLRSRLRNVVEEMAIASGVPVPEIYVLEQEMGINAFAAGFAPGDAAIAVTRGTLELLDRDELQGVIGHEFSHILNGDMRLNIRLMGVLFGIMALGLMGRMVFRGVRYSGFSSKRGKGGGIILIIGLGLIILGCNRRFLRPDDQVRGIPAARIPRRCECSSVYATN